MKITSMFKDDVTKDWSLIRVSVALILLCNLCNSIYFLIMKQASYDIPSNWVALISTLYLMSKGASTAITTLGSKIEK